MTTLIEQLVPFVELFDHTVLVSLPSLATKLADNGIDPTVVGVQPTFDFLPGYKAWSPMKPVYIEPAFECVIASVGAMKPSRLFEAVRILTHFNTDAAIVIVHAAEFEKTVVDAFSAFNVQPRDLVFDGLSVSSNWEF